MLKNNTQDKQKLIKLANYKMPFGKYAGYLLVDIPEPYYIWFAGKGFPNGELGEFMKIMLEVKINGLEYLFEKIKGKELEEL